MIPLHVLPSLAGTVGARPQRGGSQADDAANFPNLLGQVATGERGSGAARPEGIAGRTAKGLTNDVPNDGPGSSASLDTPTSAGSASLMVLLAPLFQSQPTRPTAGAGPGTPVKSAGTGLLAQAATIPVPASAAVSEKLDGVPVTESPMEKPPLLPRETANAGGVSGLPADALASPVDCDAPQRQPTGIAPAGTTQTATSFVPMASQKSPLLVRPAVTKPIPASAAVSEKLGGFPVTGSPLEKPSLLTRETADARRVTGPPPDALASPTGLDASERQPAGAMPAGATQTATPFSPMDSQKSPLPVRPAAAKQVTGVAPGSSPSRSQGVAAARTLGSREGAPSGPDATRTSDTGPSDPKPTNSATPAVTAGPSQAGSAPSAAEQVVTALQQVGLGAVPAEPRPMAAPGAPAPSSATAQENTPAFSPQARSLTIDLNPENLGPVSVTLRKTATGVDIKIAVATPEALHALERDRHVLTAAVEAAGGSHDRLALTNMAVVHADAAALAAPQTGGQDPPSQGAAPPGASAGGGQPRDQQRSDPSRAAQTFRDDETPTPPPVRSDRLDGSLYL